MDRIRHLAQVSIGRGVGFAAFGIVAMMFALAATPHMAVRAGAILFTLLSVVLLLRARRAPHCNYRRTELWVLLDRKHGIEESSASRIITGVLHDVYLVHAELTAAVAGLLWLLALAGWLFFPD
jgi:hypothetical protein